MKKKRKRTRENAGARSVAQIFGEWGHVAMNANKPTHKIKKKLSKTKRRTKNARFKGNRSKGIAIKEDEAGGDEVTLSRNMSVGIVH